MSVYSVIPARSGSKGVPNKNIKPLGDKPLIQWSIETSQQSSKIDRTIVTTDSNYYIKLALSLNTDIAIKRPKILSSDTAKDIDYLLHLIYRLELNEDDILVLLRPTTPLRDVKIVDSAITAFNNTPCYSSLRSMHKLNEPPEKMCKIVDNLAVPYMDNTIESSNLPRQNFNDCYHPNGYVDVMRVSSIIESKTTYGKYIYPFITKPVIEIDSKEDFEDLERKIQ